MIRPLDVDERNMLHRLCYMPWLWNRHYDPEVSQVLERRGLAQTSLLGQLCPTAAGRLMVALYDL